MAIARSGIQVVSRQLGPTPSSNLSNLLKAPAKATFATTAISVVLSLWLTVPWTVVRPVRIIALSASEPGLRGPILASETARGQEIALEVLGALPADLGQGRCFIMSRIFISYRREDSSDVVGLLFDYLEAHFGRQAVFMDVESIPLGVDFRDHIRAALDQCGVVLVVIGSRWLTVADEKGSARLLDPDDHVRIEIEQALQRDVPVIPVLVSGGKIPAPDQVPSSLTSLSFHNAATLRSGPDFKGDVNRLVSSIQRFLRSAAIPGRRRNRTDQPQAAREVGFSPWRALRRLPFSRFQFLAAGTVVALVAAVSILGPRVRGPRIDVTRQQADDQSALRLTAADAAPGTSAGDASSRASATTYMPTDTREADSGKVRLVYPSPEGDTQKNPRYLLVREDAYYAQPGDTRLEPLSEDGSGGQMPSDQLTRFLDDIDATKGQDYLGLLVQPGGIKAYRVLASFLTKAYPQLPTVRIPFDSGWEYCEDAARAEPFPFRPRWDIAGAKGTAYFVIEANHISQLDLATLQNRLRDAAPPSRDLASGGVISLPGSDFDARLSSKPQVVAGQVMHQLFGIVFTRRPGAVGESLERLQHGANSIYQAVLRSVDPRRVNVTLVVYADSFDGCYTARNIAWNAGFDVDWIPKEMGEPVEFSFAPSSSSAVWGTE